MDMGSPARVLCHSIVEAVRSGVGAGGRYVCNGIPGTSPQAYLRSDCLHVSEYDTLRLHTPAQMHVPKRDAGGCVYEAEFSNSCFRAHA